MFMCEETRVICEFVVHSAPKPVGPSDDYIGAIFHDIIIYLFGS